MHVEVAAQLEIPPLGYVFVAILLIIVGIALVALTIEIPVVNILTSILGWSLILFGAYVGLIGVVGEQTAQTIVGIVFLIIWGAGTVIIILFQMGILGKAIGGV